MTGMEARGIDAPTRERIFEQLKGFADFGFPESHSFSFAHIVYASAWLKVHAPEHFYAAILASQPMGFYSPATLVQDARRHGVRVLAPSVNDSLLDASVERGAASASSYRAGRSEPLPSRQIVPVDVDPSLAVRIGLSQVRGLGQAAGRILEARKEGAFESQADLARRAHLGEGDMEKLALSGALECLGVGRREGMWAAGALAVPEADSAQWQPFLPGTEVGARPPALPSPSRIELMRSDMHAIPTSLRLSRATLRTIKSNLFWAFAYNTIAVPVAAAGLLNPMIAGAAMAFSSVFVVLNSMRLTRFER